MPIATAALRAVSTTMKSVLAAGCLALAACGGGGGGGSGGGGGGGGGTATPPSQASIEFPDVVTASFPENAGFLSSDTSFQFTAPTDALPTNVQLVGADGNFFQIAILTTAPNSSGVRTITLRTQTLATLDFENPADANRDNVYTFELRGVYQGETLVATVNVTITDVADLARADATIIKGEATNQLFGSPIISIPDITGDAKPEIGVSIQSGLGPASAYIISSEFYSSIASGTLQVSAMANAGARFSQTPATTTPPIGPNRPFAMQTLRPNLLSALSAATGAGTEILLSDSERRKLYLWKLSAPADFNAFRGTVDPETIPNAITYLFDPAMPIAEGRLIPDVNGDGVNDIFVQQSSRATTASSRFGIIFGRAATSAGDRVRGGAFDIEFTSASHFGGLGLTYVVPYLLPDTDGDGNRDLAISAPGLSTIWTDQGSGVLWVIKSAILRSGVAQSLNLDALTAGQGGRINGFAPGNLYELDDTDGDTFKSVLFSFGGGSGSIADANQILPTPVTTASQLFAIGAGFTPGKFLAQGGNFDGDTVDDYVWSPAGSGITFVARGAPVRSGTPPSRPPAGSLQIDLRQGITYAQHEAMTPAWLKESALVAFGVVSLDGINQQGVGNEMTSGRIILVKEADIRRSVTTPSTGLEIH